MKWFKKKDESMNVRTVEEWASTFNTPTYILRRSLKKNLGIYSKPDTSVHLNDAVSAALRTIEGTKALDNLIMSDELRLSYHPYN
jgi:hypothetical protein